MNTGKILLVVCLAIIIGGTGFIVIQQYVLPALVGPVGLGDQVKIQVYCYDPLTEAAVSPAGITVVAWGPSAPGGISLSETPDGIFTSGNYFLEGETVQLRVADSGNTYYTTVVTRVVPDVEIEGTTISSLDPISVQPRSATSADDISVSILNQAGSAISNASAVATGEQTWTFHFSISSNKAWGSGGYTDPETGYVWTGPMLVFRFNNTAGCTYTVDGSSGYVLGASYTYYWFNLGQMANDGDITGDESYTVSVSMNLITAGSYNDDLDLGLFTSGRNDQLTAGYFGATFPGDVQKADNLIGIDIT